MINVQNLNIPDGVAADNFLLSAGLLYAVAATVISVCEDETSSAPDLPACCCCCVSDANVLPNRVADVLSASAHFSYNHHCHIHLTGFTLKVFVILLLS